MRCRQRVCCSSGQLPGAFLARSSSGSAQAIQGTARGGHSFLLPRAVSFQRKFISSFVPQFLLGLRPATVDGLRGLALQFCGHCVRAETEFLVPRTAGKHAASSSGGSCPTRPTLRERAAQFSNASIALCSLFGAVCSASLSWFTPLLLRGPSLADGLRLAGSKFRDFIARTERRECQQRG